MIKARHLQVLMLVVLAVVAAAGSLVFAQGTSGSLTGQITDAAGAALVGTNVTLTNVDTSLTLSAKTDATGVYSFNLIPPGKYELTIAAPGFAEYVQKGIVINANLYATQNVALKVASAGATISVTADAQLIDTTTPELGITINQDSVSELPLNGRDPSQLALLSPGVQDGNRTNVAWSQSGFSFANESAASSNGGRIGSTFYMLDGVTNMDNYLAENSPTPNPDATAEFRLISSNFSAAYGFSSGGVVSMSTKSGSNDWHGGLFEFMRNGDFDAGNWNNHQQDTFRRNQFGGYVGGPAIKDKLFFFANYQRTIVVGGPGMSNIETTVPTTQMLNGDFSGLIDYAQAQNPGNDPTKNCGSGYGVSAAFQKTSCGWLNGPFHTVNGIPNQLIGGAAALDPIAVQFTNLGLPGHTAPASGTAPPTSSAQNLHGDMLYAQANLANSTYDENTDRIDFDLTKSQRLTVRSFIDKFVQPSGDTPGNVLSVLNLNTWNQTFGEQFWYFNEIAQHTWTINPTTVNTVTAFWTQQSAHNGTAVDDSAGKPMCWSRFINVVEPACYMEGNGFGGGTGGWTEPSNEVRGTLGLSDTLIKTLGRHTISAGIDLIHQRAVETTQFPQDAIISFGGSYTGTNNADWLLGYMGNFEQGAGELSDVQGYLIDPYVNDEFRLKPGLTLTLGLRWEPDLPPAEVGGRGAAFVAGQQSYIFPAAPTGLIYPGDTNMTAGLRPGDDKYFEPRVGIAYQPKNLPRTSIHAGFGLFTAPVAYADYNHTVDLAPFAPTFNPNAPSNSPICAGGCTPNTGQTLTGYENFHNPWATSSFGTGGVSPFGTGAGQIPWANPTYKAPTNAPIATPISLGASFNRNFKEGVTQAWNFSVEQQIGAVTAIRVAYVGNQSYHQSLVQDDNISSYTYYTYYNNPTCPIPEYVTLGLAPGPKLPYNNFTSVLEYYSPGTASYHSLQATFQRHLSHGLQAQSSFTWEKSTDVSSTANISNGGENDNPRNLAWSRGISNANVPFIWVSNFVYTSPALRGQSLLVREALAGWEISPIITWQSGVPFSINGGNSNVYTAIIPGYNLDPITGLPDPVSEPNKGSGCLNSCGSDRADRVPGVPLNVRQGGRSNWTKAYFNPAAFTVRHDGTFGTSGRNIFQGPPDFNIDSSLAKNWSIRERYKLQFRFEFFNATNHPVMANPDNTAGDANFGKINGGNGGLGGTASTNVPRVGQAALKFTF
jgi:hypothetical protein